MVGHLILGLIFDTFGRKIPVIFGFTLMGVAILGIPFFRLLFPSFCILRICISVGSLPGMNVPLLPDYVMKESLGLASGYLEIVICITNIIVQSGLLQVTGQVSDPKNIYFGIAAFIFAVAIFLSFAIKDVVSS